MLKCIVLQYSLTPISTFLQLSHERQNGTLPVNFSMRFHDELLRFSEVTGGDRGQVRVTSINYCYFTLLMCKYTPFLPHLRDYRDNFILSSHSTSFVPTLTSVALCSRYFSVLLPSVPSANIHTNNALHTVSASSSLLSYLSVLLLHHGQS